MQSEEGAEAPQADQYADDEHNAAEEVGVALGLVGGHPSLAAGVGEEIAHLAKSAHTTRGEDEEQQTGRRLGHSGVDAQSEDGDIHPQEPQ